MTALSVANYSCGDGAPLLFMCGPCVIESEDLIMQTAERLKRIGEGRQLIFKSSYDKANRTSISSFRGPGIDEGLRILAKVRDELEMSVMTDVHSPEEARQAGEVCDLLQIPAFLCRQTDLLVAAAQTGKVINIKKGQFVAPWDMRAAVEKVRESGNSQIMLTERGATFGYNNLVSDMRSLAIMRQLGVPVAYDATHSVQLPGGQGAVSGGQREFIPVLARAAVAAGCDAVYLETHPNPVEAKSDAACMLPLDDAEQLLVKLEQIHTLVNERVPIGAG